MALRAPRRVSAWASAGWMSAPGAGERGGRFLQDFPLMYLSPEPMSIRRHFARVGARKVHYRRAGHGPPLLVLHQSPTSSAEMADSVLAFAPHFTVIAPDTPGYGLSEPLALPQPEMADYAEALAGLLDALGIARCGLYGTHTGAMIAAEFARRFPARTAAAVLDGYVVLTESEREALLARYFVDVPPKADGGHLAWYWSRIRDQVIFFPWYDQRRAARMRFDVPPAEALQPYVLDLLRADRMGTPAYAAAFRYPAVARAAEWRAQVWLLNYAQDAIADHPERLGPLPDCVRREALADPQALQARALEILAEATAGLPVPAPGPTPAGPGRTWVDTPAGQCLLRRGGAGPPMLLLLHAPGMSSREWLELPAEVRASWAWQAPDLPGHGDSAAPWPDDLDTLLATLTEMLAGAGDDPTLVALEETGWLALALRARRPTLRLILVDLPMPDGVAAVPGLAPELSPCDHGGHLLAAWQRVRDAELFRPWHRPSLEHSLAREFELAPERLQRRCLDLLLAARALPGMAATLATLDVPALLARPGAPIRLVARAGNGAEADVAAAARLAGTVPETWPAALADWSTALLLAQAATERTLQNVTTEA